ncbi:unnamed protein product [Tuwongella immobilis]|uniref:Uncharacterized protein n=1 Tax=Tuwongella immobilis TaxID=692036 RepID=A0A6C2YH37_9BACT|nr:unnamed protein product [Tuwongella immobilis]VTR96576.1 unnamed protein product [Tuwongella immobilis]
MSLIVRLGSAIYIRELTADSIPIRESTARTSVGSTRPNCPFHKRVIILRRVKAQGATACDCSPPMSRSGPRDEHFSG